MIPTVITTHEDDAAELLTDAYKGQPVLEGLLRVRARRWQKLEDAVWATINGRLLDNAQGVWLDKIGVIVKEARNGRDDTKYRAAVRLKIRINRSRGRTSDLIAVALLLDPTAKYVECFPLGWEVSIYETNDGGHHIRALAKTKAATTYGVLLTSNWDDERCTWDYLGEPAPTLASITPNTGPDTGGTAVSLVGTGFQVGVAATIDGVSLGSLVRVDSMQITGTSPARPAGAKNVRVTNPDAQFAELVGGFTYTGGAPAPALASANYTVFDNAGGDSITFTGTDLDSATDVIADPGGLNVSCSITGNTSTTVTIDTPAIAAGTYDVVVVTAGGTSNALSLRAIDFSIFKGARAPYSASPWVGFNHTANFTESTNPPAAGTAVNGFAPADFDGANDQLVSSGTGAPASNYVSTAAGTVLALVNVDTVAANNATVSANEGIVTCLNSLPFGLYVSDAGLRAMVTDSGGTKQLTVAGLGTGAWHLAMVRWDSTNAYASVDAGTPASTACLACTALTQTVRLGTNHNGGTRLDGSILDVLMAQSAVSDVDVADYWTALRCRYAL